MRRAVEAHLPLWLCAAVHVHVHVALFVREETHLPLHNIKDLACPAELPRWLSWQSVCLVCRTSQVQIPPEAALLFLLGKKGVVFGRSCFALPSLND